MRLTKPAVAKLSIPDGKSERIVFDDELPGFGLRLRAGGSAVWIAQYRIGTQQRRVTLGKLSTLDPDKARVEARKVLANADLGTDVQAERRRRQAKEAITFGSVVDLYLVHAEKALRPRTLVEVRRYFARDWKPFRPLPIGEVQRAEISARLRVIAETHGPIASNRARAALSGLYAWAVADGLADANPVIGSGRAGIEKARERVLSADEIVAIWNAAEDDDHGTIVKLLLLTGQRRAEVAGIEHREIDLAKAVWLLPESRTKNGKPHDLPLSRQAAALLGGLSMRHGRSLMFGRGDGPFSGWSQSKSRLDARIARRRAEQRLGRALRDGESPASEDALVPWTLHDLRRTVVTGMNELGVQPHVVEAVVNHLSGVAKAGVAGVYNRALYAAEKRMALQVWADHLDLILGLGERKVIPLRA